MSQNIISQLKRLEEVGAKNIKTTRKLIATAQKIDPTITTRDQALELARRIKPRVAPKL